MPIKQSNFDDYLAGQPKANWDAYTAQFNDYGGVDPTTNPTLGKSRDQLIQETLGGLTRQQWFDKNLAGQGRQYDPTTNTLGMMDNNNFELSPLAVAGAMFGLAAPAIAAGGAAGSAAGGSQALPFGESGFLAGEPAAGGGVAGTNFDYWDFGSNNPVNATLEPAGGWGDTQSIGQLYGGGTGTGAGILDQIGSLLKSSGMSPTSIASLLGKLGAAGLGAYGSNQQAKSLADLARQYSEQGAPSRARFEASMAPGFDPRTIPGYSAALDNSAEAILRKLSTQGNPFGNPGGLIEANKAILSGTALPAINEYQRINLGAGGLANLNAAIPGLQTGSIGQQGNVLNSLGYGLNAVASPQPTLADLIKQLQIGGLT